MPSDVAMTFDIYPIQQWIEVITNLSQSFKILFLCFKSAIKKLKNFDECSIAISSMIFGIKKNYIILPF